MSIMAYIGSKIRAFAGMFRTEETWEEERINWGGSLLFTAPPWGESIHAFVAGDPDIRRLDELHADLAKAKRQKKRHSHIKAEIDELRAKMALEEV